MIRARVAALVAAVLVSRAGLAAAQEVEVDPNREPDPEPPADFDREEAERDAPAPDAPPEPAPDEAEKAEALEQEAGASPTEEEVPAGPLEPIEPRPPRLPEPTGPAADETTDVWEPGTPMPNGWDFLRLPERVIQLAFTPLAPIVYAVEVQRLDEHFGDLFKPESDFYIVPLVAFSTGDNFGYGLRLTHRNLLGEDEVLKVQVLSRIGGDIEAEAEFEQEIARWEGRQYRLLAAYTDDSDLKYYGTGGDTDEDDKSSLKENLIEVRGSLDLTELGAPVVKAVADVGYVRQTLEPGVPSSSTPSFDPMGELAPPPGFGVAAHLPEVRLRVEADTRDSEGASTTGLEASLEVMATHDVTGNDLSGMRWELGYRHYFPVLPRFRTLILQGGLGFAHDFGPGHDIPLHALVKLGSKNHLRGYHKQRFLGEIGWWLGVEYRYPLYEYLSTGVGVSTLLFADFGGIGNSFGEVADGPIHWSVGTGARLETSTRTLGQVVIGFSPEGMQVVAGVKGAI